MILISKLDKEKERMLWILLPLFLFIFFILKWIANFSEKNNQLPSPPKLPIIGNLHQIGSLPHRSLHLLSKKYGHLMLLHFGSKPTLVVSSAEGAREIMKTHDLIFSNRPNSTLANKLVYGSRDVAFSPMGEDWRQRRSIMVLQLLSNKRVASLKSIREDEIMIMIEKIKSLCCSPNQMVNLSKMLISLTNDMVCRVALGRKYRSEEIKGMDYQRRLDNFTELAGIFDVGDYIPWLRWVNNLSGLYRRAETVAKEFDGFLESIVEEHLKNEQNNGHNYKDFVDVLLEYQRENTSRYCFSREGIKALILDVFVAGTDTTYTALEWTMTELIRHPRTLKKLQNEVRDVADAKKMTTGEDLEKMHYLKAVMKESLRLHPPVPLLVPRETTEDVKFMGYDIKARTLTIVNAYAINRDPSTWDKPEVFRPERFLGNPVDYKGRDFQFIPFGSGRRVCPGIEFAISVDELAVANLVRNFDFDLPDGVRIEDMDMGETVGITVHKKIPLHVVVNLVPAE